MNSEKKKVRANFRNRVFQRDGYRCKVCGIQSSPETCLLYLDAHHIITREEMPNGGYVKENGITLCKSTEWSCHALAERGEYTKDHLFSLIASSPEIAMKACQEKSMVQS